MQKMLSLAVLLAAFALPAQADPVIHDLQIANNDHRTLWVTIYHKEGGSTRGRIIAAFCMKPKEMKVYSADLRRDPNAGGVFLRGEVTRNGDCQHPVDCDTEIVVNSGNWPLVDGARKPRYRFETNPQRCWFSPIVR